MHQPHSFSFADIGEKSVVADFHEPLWQHVKEKATDKFHCRQFHGAGAVIVTSVFVGEDHPIVVDGLDAVIGNRDFMCISTQVRENLFRAGEGLFGIDDPLLLPGLGRQGGVVAWQGEVGGLLLDTGEVSLLHLFCQGIDLKQEVVSARYPPTAIEGEHPGWNEAMDMKMIDQGLAPGMENGQQARLAFKAPFRIGGKGQDRVPYRRKQKSQQLFFVGEDDRVESMGDGEHHMEIAARQEFRPSFFQPLFFGHDLAFWAVSVPAGVVAVPDAAAMIADFLVAA